MQTLFTRIRSRRGYTLLFAVLTAAVVLGVAVFILDISRKQFLLSTTSRESMFSIYAADSGRECAVWSLNNNGSGINTATSTSPAILACAGSTFSSAWTAVPWNSSGIPPVYANSLQSYVYETQKIPISLADGTCALVTLFDGYDNANRHLIVVDSRGYNLCDATSGTLGPSASAETVERALQYSVYR